MDVYYSTGQAAQELGVTQAKVRTLCETEAIDSTSTAGGQYRISKDEVERLKREGLPAIPRPLPELDRPSAVGASRSHRRHTSLLAKPSEVVIDSAEEVVRLENEVKTIGLRRQKEEELDWFRERDDRAAADRAKREEAERLQKAQVEADRQRHIWEEKWLKFALASIPREAQAYRLDVHQIVKEALKDFNLVQSESITRQLVAAAVKRALAPWYERKQVSDAIRKACESFSVPWDMKSDSTWKARMQKEAGEGIARVRNGATKTEIETAAQQAIISLVREFEHGRTCNEIVKQVWLQVPTADRAQLEEASEVVRKAIAQLPVGASRRDIEQARAVALVPIQNAIAARQDREMRVGLLQHIELRFMGWPDNLRKQASVAMCDAIERQPAGTPRFELERIRDQAFERFHSLYKKHEQKARLIESGLRKIRPYLDVLNQEWEFDENAFTLARDLEKPIRALLEQELSGKETEENVTKLVRRGVKAELEIES